MQQKHILKILMSKEDLKNGKRSINQMKMKMKSRRRLCLYIARAAAAAGFIISMQAVGLGELEKISLGNECLRILVGGGMMLVFGYASLWMRERIQQIESRPQKLQKINLTVSTVVVAPEKDKPIRKVVL